MKKISIWASQNKGIARLLLVVLHLILVSIALILGSMLFFEDILILKGINYALLGLLLVSFLFYPIKKAKSKWWKYSYRRQKTMDLLIAASSFLMLICTVNQGLNQLVPSTSSNHYRVIKTSWSISSTAKEKADRATLRYWKKTFRKKFKEVRKQARIERRKSSNKKRGLLKILLFVGAGVILLGVGSLSCGFLCAGSESPAALLSLGGFGYASFLTVTGLREIIKSMESGEYRI